MPKANPAALRYIAQRYGEGYYDYDDMEDTEYANDTAPEEEAQTEEA